MSTPAVFFRDKQGTPTKGHPEPKKHESIAHDTGDGARPVSTTYDIALR